MDNVKFFSKISIIVPVYNVEKYIRKCISSISEQTYKNIEIIAVDDGSTDESGKILDEISKGEPRIKIIHKKNEGVSAARNDGLAVATGDYVSFVDGDDYISKDYADYMAELAASGADFCLSTNCYMKKGEKQIEELKTEKYSPDDATALLLSCKVIVGCWNKLYKREFLKKNNLTFSSKLFYGEGLYFIVNAAQCANFVTVGNKKVYYYRRDNENSACTNFNIKKIQNGEESLKYIEKELVGKTKAIDSALMLHMAMFHIGAAVRIKTNNLEKKYSDDYKRRLGFIRKNIFSILTDKRISLYRKILLFLGCISPKLLSTLDIKRRKRISDRSI